MPHPKYQDALTWLRGHPASKVREIAEAIDLPSAECFELMQELCQDDQVTMLKRRWIEDGIHKFEFLYSARRVR